MATTTLSMSKHSFKSMPQIPLAWPDHLTSWAAKQGRREWGRAGRGVYRGGRIHSHIRAACRGCGTSLASVAHSILVSRGPGALEVQPITRRVLTGDMCWSARLHGTIMHRCHYLRYIRSSMVITGIRFQGQVLNAWWFESHDKINQGVIDVISRFKVLVLTLMEVQHTLNWNKISS